MIFEMILGFAALLSSRSMNIVREKIESVTPFLRLTRCSWDFLIDAGLYAASFCHF